MGTAIVLALAYSIASEIWNRHVFSTMTPAQHLREARNGLRQDLPAIESALRHAYAIREDSPEFRERVPLQAELEKEEYDLNKAANDLKKAEEEKTMARNEADAARAAAISKLAADLKSLGYDVSVEPSESPDAVTITSSDFDDTDHRVRFLSFLRGNKAPTVSVCWAGITKVQLRGSRIAFLGFNEIYSLDCFR